MRRVYGALFTFVVIALATFVGFQNVQADNAVFTFVSASTASCNVGGNGGSIAITWDNNNNGGDVLTIYRSDVSGGVAGGADGGPWTQIAVIGGNDPRLSPSNAANPVTFFDVSSNFVIGQTYYYKMYETHQGNVSPTLAYGQLVFGYVNGVPHCLAPTTTTLNQPSVNAGDKTVSLTATVTYGNNQLVPSGTVVLKIFDTTTSPAQLLASTTITIDQNNPDPVSATLNIGDGGFNANHTYQTEADYSDGSTYGMSVGYGTIAVGKNPTQLTVTPVSVPYGTPTIPLSAVLVDVHDPTCLTANPQTCAPVSGATVSFTLVGSPVCGGSLPACPTTDSNGTASITVPLPSSITAGDYGTGIGASAAATNTTGPSNATGDLTITPVGATVGVTGSPNPSSFNQSVIFTATVTGVGGGAIPTGTVSFYDGGSCDTPGTTLASGVVLDGTGTAATGGITSLAVGSHSIVACFSGDVNYGAAPGSTTQTVNSDTTTTSVPSPTITYGNDGSITVTVTSDHGGTPTGSVVLSVKGNPLPSQNLVAGSTTFTITKPLVGTYPLSATYTPADSSFAGSSGTGTLQVNKADVTVTVASDSPNVFNNNLGINVQTSDFGQAVTLTVGATSTGGTPTGTITVQVFTDYDGLIPFNPPITATSTYNANNCACWPQIGPIYNLPIGGPRKVVASYSGDANFNTGTASLTHQVVKDPTTTVVTSSSTNNTSTYGDFVTLTATVTGNPPASGPSGFQPTAAPSGVVAFWDASAGATCANLGGSTSLGVADAPLQAASGSSSTATKTMPGNFLSAGSHNILACYVGDTNYGSSGGSVTQTVNPFALTVSAGTYSGTYDGQSHALSACAVSPANNPDSLTCTNNPVGPVGPDATNGAQTVTPTLSGPTTNYNVTTNNGSYSIAPRAVTITAGSYGPAAYDGNAHALSACGSSDPTFVTCTNSPVGPVGPDFGSGTVTPTAVYGQGNANDYTITANDGSWSIAKRAVTITAGSYGPAAYDGNAHALSACGSSDPTFVTCTNSPVGPVGPDFGSGTVTPTAVFGKGNSNDYTITANNGSWSITALAVTLTAGSYSGTYDGQSHSPSPCLSSNALLSCTNDPSSVGPGYGSGSVTPTPNYGNAVAADFSITSKPGSWSIAKATLTVSAGSYSGTYDGSAHPLSACTVSPANNPDGVTCTNTPAGPVGPDYGSGTVVPSISGSTSNYSVTINNGSWSIAKLGVTITGGSYSGTFDGNAHSLTCTSSAPSFVTCSNSPSSVTNVGSGSVVPSVSGYLSGSIASDFTVSPVNGAWSITAYPDPVTITITTDKGNASGVPTVQYSDLVGISVSMPILGGIKPLNPLGPNPPAVCIVNGVTPDACVQVSIGAQVFTVPMSVQGVNLAGSISNQQLFDAPGSQPVTLILGNGVNNLSQLNTDYSLVVSYVPNNGTPAASLNVNVRQEDALVTYTGNDYFAVPPTQTTVNIPVSYTLQDATATATNSGIWDAYAGDITKTFTVSISLSGQYYDPAALKLSNFSSSCSGVPVGAVLGAVDPTNGLPSTATTGSCTLSGVPVNGSYQLTITPDNNSYYTFPSGIGDAVVTIGTSNGGGGFITGGGYQTASYLNSLSNLHVAPKTVLGTLATKTNFGFTAKYNKSGSNLQASVNIITRTTCMDTKTAATLGYPSYAPHPGDDGLCVYQIKSNKVISMSDTPYSATGPGYGVLVVGANIQDVTQSTTQGLMGGGTLQLVMYDNAEPGAGKDTITFQVTDNKGNLWFSSSWNGTTTQIFNGSQTKSTVYAPVINGGNLQVH